MVMVLGLTMVVLMSVTTERTDPTDHTMIAAFGLTTKHVVGLEYITLLPFVCSSYEVTSMLSVPFTVVVMIWHVTHDTTRAYVVDQFHNVIDLGIRIIHEALVMRICALPSLF